MAITIGSVGVVSCDIARTGQPDGSYSDARLRCDHFNLSPVDEAMIHEYPVAVTWSGGRDGQGSVQPEGSGVVIPLAVPPEFQGPGGATNPEEMLTSAIASCYSITFGIIAANRKLPVLGLKTEAVGEVEQQGAAFTFKKITIRPQISVRSDATEAEIGQVMDFARRADAYCIVTNAIRDKVSVVLDPAVRVIEA